ncbi:hypothetical protein [Cellulophaga baltica]|uniref:Uncharacterized protein n=1 Tax=Cellulophaga baltica TaxID=76594 RepID=A0A1G7JMT9_9FLAO|nr:hypothetical protein [Cellulophaga baltica]SDF26175.1 hypothetical protein SAMN04487992_1104 [Cellulophaga baltica]
MKKKLNNPSIEKFRIAKISRPDFIMGGGPDDGTEGSDTEEKQCILKSTKHVIIKKL